MSVLPACCWPGIGALNVDEWITNTYLIEYLHHSYKFNKVKYWLRPSGTCASVLGGVSAGMCSDRTKYAGQSPWVLKGVICELLGTLLRFPGPGFWTTNLRRAKGIPGSMSVRILEKIPWNGPLWASIRLLARHQGKYTACLPWKETHCVWWWLWVSELQEAGCVCVCARAPMSSHRADTLWLMNVLKIRILCLFGVWFKFLSWDLSLNGVQQHPLPPTKEITSN